MNDSSPERLRRWRLILGGEQADGTGCTLGSVDAAMDRALAALYGDGAGGGATSSGKRSAGLGASAPTVSRWLGDIRTYFPTPVVRVMQQDAMERLNLHSMLTEPEMLESVVPDVHLVAELVSLSGVIPKRSKETARAVVRKVVEDLMKKLASPMRQAVYGSLNRAVRNYRPRFNEIDWPRTIRANLKNYQPDYRTVVPERLIGFGRRRSSLRDVILCVDQSGSMATSVVFSGIFGAVMASLPAVQTKIVVFDTAVVDMTDKLSDPVELLFGVQLGGGTDINRAIAYCQGLVTRPGDTIMVLISDLIEGGVRDEMLKRCGALAAAGVQMIALLALSDDGAPCFDHENAASLASLGIPAFACTPDQFPDLMAAAIQRQDLRLWAAKHNIASNRAQE